MINSVLRGVGIERKNIKRNGYYKMNILLISYGIYEYDGRLRELIKVAKMLGNTTYITRGTSKNSKQDTCHQMIPAGGMFNYLRFIFTCIITAKNASDVDIIIADNRRATIPILILRRMKFIKNSFIVQDVRELYIKDEIKSFVGKIGCIFESKLMKKADILICANKYRAKIMKEIYSLKTEPLVYENIRKLEFKSKDLYEKAKNKFANMFQSERFKIVSTSGCSINRTNDLLVKAMAGLGDEYELFLVGASSKEDINNINKLIKEYRLDNVKIIGNVEEHELKYIISKCDVGVVNYHQKDKNNKYCASGKLFEFIFERIPIICTDNPPLKEICEDYGVGIADNNYEKGIQTIRDEYAKFCKNVDEYALSLDTSENNRLLADKIIENLSQRRY